MARGIFDDYSYEGEYKIFQERDVDKVITLFDWFRPEDLFFISFILWVVTPIAGAIYIILKFDILIIFSIINLSLGIYLSPYLYLFWLVVGIPFVYLKSINAFRKRYSNGYVGRKFYSALHSRVRGHYNPLKDKYLFDE